MILMKTSFILLAVVATISVAESKCNTKAIGYYKESGFGLSFGGGSSSAGFYDKNTVNVPLTINDQQACFKKTSAFTMKSEKKKDKPEENNITMTPMKVEFENVPAAHQKQYIFVEKNENKFLTKFHVMSFTCAGEIPLAIEALSDTVIAIQNKKEGAEVHVTSTFATGAAAENLGMANQGKVYSQETFDFFRNLYKSKTTKEMLDTEICCTTTKVPSIISDTSIKSLAGVERAIASSFTTMNSDVPNGCSKNFVETMKNYQLENYKENDSLKSYKVKKKFFSDDLVFEW